MLLFKQSNDILPCYLFPINIVLQWVRKLVRRQLNDFRRDTIGIKCIHFKLLGKMKEYPIQTLAKP